MSALMKQAGFVKSEFPFAESHSVYIRRFIKARRDKEKKAAFWGYRLGEDGGQPDVGDLIVYARGKNMTAKKATTYFDRTSDYESHTDLVVAKRSERNRRHRSKCARFRDQEDARAQRRRSCGRLRAFLVCHSQAEIYRVNASLLNQIQSHA